MSITAKEVNELRQKTGAGLMDCKNALTESDGDMDAAIDYLRKKGQKVSQKRSDKEAVEGVAIAETSKDKKRGAIIYLSSETDFVAKNDSFISFAKSIADLAVTEFPSSREELLGLQHNGVTVEEKVNEQVGVINENIQLARYETSEAETVIAYNHAGYKIGVLVELNKPADEQIEQIGKDLAMQIAAMTPIALDKDGVPQETIEKERSLAREQAINEGKPEKVVDQIAEGKLRKFYEESTLLNQQFVKDSQKTVREALQEIDPELEVKNFKRVAIGQ
ncbi:MAG: elongation factor Ts [Bacteroidetes bacterium SW_11_45_7]|nr:MAG: elongation factor Ts [Bacteroidetes bacterium SW_11_45_7]